MLISGVPISALLGFIGLLFDKNKKPAIITLVVIAILLASVFLTRSLG